MAFAAVDLDGPPVLLGALQIQAGQCPADLLDVVEDGGVLWTADPVAEVGAIVADEQERAAR